MNVRTCPFSPSLSFLLPCWSSVFHTHSFSHAFFFFTSKFPLYFHGQRLYYYYTDLRIIKKLSTCGQKSPPNPSQCHIPHSLHQFVTKTLVLHLGNSPPTQECLSPEGGHMTVRATLCPSVLSGWLAGQAMEYPNLWATVFSWYNTGVLTSPRLYSSRLS